MTGELDIAAGLKVEAALSCAVELGAPTIVIDLSGVTFIDAYIIGLIVNAHGSSIERGVTLAVSGLDDHVAQLFEVLELGQLVLTAADADGTGGDGTGGDVDGRR